MLLDLLGDAALIASSAYLFGRNKFITQCVYNPMKLRNFLTLVCIFSTLSIIETYHGIPVEDALANTRLVGTLIAGIMDAIDGAFGRRIRYEVPTISPNFIRNNYANNIVPVSIYDGKIAEKLYVIGFRVGDRD